MINGPTLLLLIALGLGWFIGTEIVDGAKWIGSHAKHGIIMVVKKIHHPHEYREE